MTFPPGQPLTAMNVNRYMSAVAPGRVRFSYGFYDLRGDVLGGIVGGMVLIPVSLSFGVLTGQGSSAGLYGVLAMSLFAALVGGTKGMISGPNPNVAIIMAAVVAQYTTSIADALVAVVLAGIIQMVFGLLRFGRYISYIPSSLMAGFFLGVGILLISIQTLPAMGLDPVGGRLVGAVTAWPQAVTNLNLHALVITAITLAISILWRGRLARVAPDQFMVLVIGTLAGIFWLREAPVIGQLETGLPTLHLPELSMEYLLRIVQPAFMLALMSSISILVGSTMVASITGQEQRPNRLLFGHGVGNVAAGLIGGVPGSVANGTLSSVRSGARSPVANLTVATVVLLTLLIGFDRVIAQIPSAALAVILISTGFSLINWRLLSRIHRIPRNFTVVMLLTGFLVVFVDSIVGLVIGFVVAAFLSSRALEGVEMRRLVSVPLLDADILDDAADPFGAHSGLVMFPDVVTVASAQELVRIVGRDVGEHRIVVLDLSRTVYIDDTAAIMVGRLIGTVGAREFVISGLSPAVAQKLQSLNILARVPANNFAANLDEAKSIVKPILQAMLSAE